MGWGLFVFFFLFCYSSSGSSIQVSPQSLHLMLYIICFVSFTGFSVMIWFGGTLHSEQIVVFMILLLFFAILGYLLFFVPRFHGLEQNFHSGSKPTHLLS